MRKLKHDEIDRPAPTEVADLPKHPISVVVHNVRSIYNVGSIFRTSDAARIEHLHLTGYTGTPAHKDLHKTALGAQDTVAWTKHDDLHAVLEQHRTAGYTLAALEITDQPTSVSDLEHEHYPLCLLIGNEVRGIDDVILQEMDLALEIPQYGAKQSLNVSVAYGIAIFDLVRHVRGLHGPPTAS
jgi:tRNA G18 (ribose-2'-O)-methylase SpoU